MQFAPDGKTLVTIGENHRVKLWDAMNGRELGSLKNSLQSADGVCFSADGRRLAVATGEGVLRLWDTVTLREVAAYKMSSELQPVPGSMQFSPDGNTLAAMVTQGVQFWRAARLEESDAAAASSVTERATGSGASKPVPPP